jgi:hypothetical protein
MARKMEIRIEQNVKPVQAGPKNYYSSPKVATLESTKPDSMKHIYYFLICCIALTSGCRRESDNTGQVHKQLHGKYKAISSVTSAGVDVNMDGAASTDLLSEMDELAHCELEIRIVNKNHFLFNQFWPEQFIRPGNPPAPIVDYACQGVGRRFSIAGDNVTLQLKPDQTTPPDPNLWVFPTSVTIEGKDLIKIVFTKKLFTASGWESVTIITLYERYTMIT